MDLSDKLQCVFSAQVREQGGSYVIEVPAQEVSHGNLEPGSVYRTAIIAMATDSENKGPTTSTETDSENHSTSRDTQTEEAPATNRDHEPSGPPVQTGEVREVEIETIGDQGDGIARVERGYVIIVPETEKGDQVTIEIITVRENVAFGEVVE